MHDYSDDFRNLKSSGEKLATFAKCTDILLFSPSFFQNALRFKDLVKPSGLSSKIGLLIGVSGASPLGLIAPRFLLKKNSESFGQMTRPE